MPEMVDQDTITEDFEARGRDHGHRENVAGRLIPVPRDIWAQVQEGNRAGYRSFLKGWHEVRQSEKGGQ